MQIIPITIAVFVLTFFGIKFYLSWSRKKEIFDIPNERSSHVAPTPRGGGLVIAVICLLAYFTYFLISGQPIIWAYFAGAVIISGISWLDDLFTISIIWRFLCHSAAAFLILFSIDFPQIISIPLFGDYNFAAISFLFWFLWIVWLINAYNFMDGIDGIAGIQAFLAGIFWAILSFILGTDNSLSLGLILAVSSFVFLLYNWQPAKLFMGDVGSAFLGFNFAVLPIIASQQNSANSGEFTFAGIVFVWLFVFDSVKTLLHRISQRKKFWKAHREHLYQKLVINGLNHSTVSLLYGICTVTISTSLLLDLYFHSSFEFVLIGSLILISLGLLIWVEFIVTN